MYDNNYENYIRSILGYPNTTNVNSNTIYNMGYFDSNEMNTKSNLEDFYPEIYKIIYPMVKKVCKENMMPISNDEIEKMTDEIYLAIENNNEINLNINLNNSISNNIEEKRDIQNKNQERKEKQNLQNQDKRMTKNNNLRDLIKILLIRELLNRPMPPLRPHNPPRPPMRPPIMPREYQQPLYDIYEY